MSDHLEGYSGTLHQNALGREENERKEKQPAPHSVVGRTPAPKAEARQFSVAIKRLQCDESKEKRQERDREFKDV